MARSAPALSSFTAGEISPRLEGRITLDKYREGLSELTNMVVLPQGGVTRRPGTQFLAEVKDSAVKTRIIPFQFKTTDTYILEFGEQNMRVFRDGEQVLEGAPGTITAITNANPGVLTITGHTFTEGEEIYITGVGGMTALNGRNYLAVNVTANTFTLQTLFEDDVDTTALPVFTSGGTADAIYEIVTPYLEADLFNLRVAQSADTMYIVHPDYEIRILSRLDHNNWPVKTAIIEGGLASATSIQNITQASPGVIHSGSHGLVNGDHVKILAVVGMVELNNNYYTVAGVTSGTFTLVDEAGVAVNTTGFAAYVSGGTVQKILDPSIPITGANNRPSAVSFFEQRLVFANTTENPQTVWFSNSGDYQNFTTGVSDDDALIYTIASNQVNSIRYLSATRVLVLGTSGGEYVLSTTNDGPITPTTTQIRKYSNYGSANVEPVQVADVTLFLQRGLRKIREFRYSGAVDTGGYTAPDVTILAEHLTEGGIVQFAYQQEPDGIVWAVRADGALLGMTYRREEEVVAWHKHTIGGVFGSGNAVVESIAVLPTDNGDDELYLIVKRTIGSVTKRYLERFKQFDFGTQTTNAFFVDSGLAYAGGSVNTLAGLYHLEGQTVSILGNGASHPDRTVTNGAVSLAFSVTSAAIGLTYTSYMQTMRLESGSVDGTSQGKPKRIHAITLRLLKTVGIEVGNSANENDRIFFRDSSMNMDEAVPLFTGDKNIEFPGGFDDNDRIYVQQTQPLPMTVLAFFPRMNTFDI